jgi:hypothetical protein
MERRADTYQMDCPSCGSTNTFPTPETAYNRWCGDCLADWDMRPIDVIEQDC